MNNEHPLTTHAVHALLICLFYSELDKSRARVLRLRTPVQVMVCVIAGLPRLRALRHRLPFLNSHQLMLLQVPL